MRVNNYIPCLILLIACTACKNEKPADVSSPVVFFDLKKMVEADMQRLSGSDCGLQKTVILDGKKEEQLVNQVDFKKELQPLLDCDINKKDWRDRFAVDSTASNGEKSIRFSTDSDKIPVKSMRVISRNDTIQKIEIHKEIRSFAFSFDAQIEYYPGKGYDIYTAQKAFLIHKFVMQVHAVFTCK